MNRGDGLLTGQFFLATGDLQVVNELGGHMVVLEGELQRVLYALCQYCDSLGIALPVLGHEDVGGPHC